MRLPELEGAEKADAARAGPTPDATEHVLARTYLLRRIPSRLPGCMPDEKLRASRQAGKQAAQARAGKSRLAGRQACQGLEIGRGMHWRSPISWHTGSTF